LRVRISTSAAAEHLQLVGEIPVEFAAEVYEKTVVRKFEQGFPYVFGAEAGRAR
jgi:hypothetical protein